MLDRSASMSAKTFSNPAKNARRVEPAGCIKLEQLLALNCPPTETNHPSDFCLPQYRRSLQ
jgi:hypothetical protein